jgi:hypothetical protein
MHIFQIYFPEIHNNNAFKPQTTALHTMYQLQSLQLQLHPGGDSNPRPHVLNAKTLTTTKVQQAAMATSQHM